jgi:pimeloyl-ACP methyl ester carboxylesterase
MKRIRKIFLFFIVIVSSWLLFAQCGMSYRTTDAEAKRNFQKSGIDLFTETIETGNFKLHYAKTGNDSLPTLFFVHGSPGSWMKFGEYLKDTDLVKKYRMISVDRPGFGYSEFGEAKDLNEQSAIISILLKRLQNNKPVYAIGRSYGGPLVVKLAVDNPTMFSGLVLLAAALDPAAEKPEKWRKIISTQPLNYFIPGAWKQSNKEIIYLKTDLKELADGFATITCPVFIMHGDKDNLVSVSNAAYARKMLVNARSVSVTIIPGGGHYVSEYNFEKVKELILKF